MKTPLLFLKLYILQLYFYSVQTLNLTIVEQLQVHRAVTKGGMDVAMKIQYPGVADSIESDIENVKLLLDYTNLIPKGLYLDRAMKVFIYSMCILISVSFLINSSWDYL